MALNRDDLDRLARAGCQDPHCAHDHEGPLYLHPRCHTSADTWCRYTAGEGVLHVLCKKCGKAVAAVKVAGRSDDDYPRPV